MTSTPDTLEPRSTTTAAPPSAEGAPAPQRPGARITDWRPEDPDFWAHGGARTARRNLLHSVLTEHLGFSVWSLWSVFVLFMGPAYHVDPAGKFLLTTLPTLVGALLRVPYTYAVARFGGRTWTTVSALLLLAPCLFAAVVLKPGVSYFTLLVAAAIAGVGGGNFASSTANINAFFPARLKGAALGLNAGGGNVGVATVQLVGLLVLATAGKDHPRLLLAVYIPLIVIAALVANLRMNNLAPSPAPGEAAAEPARPLRAAVRLPHTWLVSFLYIGTFGSFIGFGFAFGQVLQIQFAAQFGTPVKAAALTFLGPLLGSLARPLGGRFADRRGGARVTLFTFAAMAAAAALVLGASVDRSLPLFLTGFVLLFLLSGIGNGSTYKMIPALVPQPPLAAAVIGVAGAVGAFGGALINVAFRESFLNFHTGNAAYISFICLYALCFGCTYFVYVRRETRP